MKTLTIKIIFAIIIYGSISSTVFAATSINISPENITKTIENSFEVNVDLNTDNNKVCAVEGTLVFNNLICQNITLSDGILGQTVPSCGNPHYLIGIPNCTTSNKVIMTVSLKAASEGNGSLNFKDVDIIGEGSSLGSISKSGNVIINKIVIQPEIKPIVKPVEEPVNKVEKKKAELMEVKTETKTDEINKIDTNINQQANVIDVTPTNNNTYLYIIIIISVILLLSLGIYLTYF